MSSVFVRLVNISLTASWIILAVVLLRLFLKKAPKWISVLLWGIVAVRLLIPVHIHSHLSLLPSAEVIPQNITTTEIPTINSSIPLVNHVVNPALEETASRVGAVERVVEYAAMIWLVGIALLMLYSLITTLRLRHQVRASLKLRDNVYICDDVAFPFVLGVFKPRIYLPSGIAEEAVSHVLAHENAHIKRKDHWWKPLGFALVTLYWFNPLMWLAYILLSRDIEQAGDEKVIAGMDVTGKKHYSEALAECSTQRRMILVCPVAFGEVSVKSRIKGVLNYKKPAFWIIMAAVAACAVASVCLLTDPFPCFHDYRMQIVENATCTSKGKERYTCTKCDHCYFKSTEVCAHSYDGGVVLSQPTCSDVGYLRKTCTCCGALTTEEIAELPHTPGQVTVTKEPNCIQQGEGTTPCTVCGTVFVVALPVNDVHDLKETIVEPATCGVAGKGQITCTRCSYGQECIYEALKHHFEYTYIISEDEYSRVWCVTCSHCGKTDINYESIPGGNSSNDYTPPTYWDPGRQVNKIEWINGYPVIVWDPVLNRG